MSRVVLLQCILLGEGNRHYYIITINTNGVAQWLRRSATNRKVSGSIPVGVIGIFY